MKDLDNEALLQLKKAIWLYFWLIIFEGALRKWFLPVLSSPLLIIREPVAIWIIYKAWISDKIPFSGLLYGMTGIGMLAIVTALFAGHGNIFVALFGARIFLLHFPLLFIIGNVFDRSDVLKVGRIVLWISIPMAVLIAVQFYSPQSAFVNRGVGGDIAGAGYSGAMGFLRPPATFSFINGTYLFFGLAASFILYFLIAGKGVNKLVLYAAVVCLIAAVPLSLSRSLAFHVVISMLFAFFLVLRKPENLPRVFIGAIAFTALVAVLFNFNFFQKAYDAFLFRFATASYTEGGLKGTLGGRYVGLMVSAISDALDQPFFGRGIGMGTNVGSMLLTGSRKFLIAEEEWGRQIGELGALLGCSVILLRLALSLRMAVSAYRLLKRDVLLPWMLLSFGLTMLPQGQWAQPTSLGFSVWIGGLIIASFRSEKQ